MSNTINAKDAAKELGLYLKLVVSTKSFENYNSFFNIFDQAEEPCRRIAVLTSFEDLEEVQENGSLEPIVKYKNIDGNIWLEEYELLKSPNKINIEGIQISIEEFEKIKEQVYKRKES